MSTPATRKRILVVDDEPEIVALLGEHLSPNYDVDTAADGVLAIERIRAHRPDLIFLDIQMPRMNGLDVLKLVKQIDATIPVVMVTANADNALAADAVKSGALSYVPKPFDFRYLDHVLAVGLAGRRR
jgi:CheY-like chemotaxis protein